MFLCHPIRIKHEYKVTNQETIIFNQSIIFWKFDLLFFTNVLTAKEGNICEYSQKK